MVQHVRAVEVGEANGLRHGVEEVAGVLLKRGFAGVNQTFDRVRA